MIPVECPRACPADSKSVSQVCLLWLARPCGEVNRSNAMQDTLRRLNSNALDALRPKTLAGIVGQEAAVGALLAKLASPFPQHVILYGPPGVGKTTVARLALELAKRRAHTPWVTWSTTALVARSVNRFGSEELKAEVLPGIPRTRAVAGLPLSTMHHRGKSIVGQFR